MGLLNLKKAGFEAMLEFYEASSQSKLPQLADTGLKVDLAFIDGWHTFDHALVDFFYVDRLLRLGGVVVFDDAGIAGLRKLCRFVATNRAYTVFQSLASRPRNWKQRIFRHRLPEPLGRLLRPEIVTPDTALGWHPFPRCIAFRKESDDARPWDYHRPF